MILEDFGVDEDVSLFHRGSVSMIFARLKLIKWLFRTVMINPPVFFRLPSNVSLLLESFFLARGIISKFQENSKLSGPTGLYWNYLF